MKTNRKTLCLLIAALTVGGAMLSCGGGDSTNQTETTAAVSGGENTETVTEEVSELEQLPAADYGGHVVNIMLNDQDDRFVDIMTEGEETGDTLNDVVYRRNRAVEEKYNVTIEGVSEEYNAVNTMIQKEVQSGLTDYDLYFSNCYASTPATGGYLYDITTLPNVDLSNPWWDTAALEGMSIGGKIYMVTGDVSPTSLLTSSCLVFNKKLFSANDMEYPYEMASNGTWTLDKLVEMTKGLTSDVNGDGKYTLNDDVFAFSSWMCDSPYSLFFGAGATFSSKDDNDIPYVDFNVDKISSVYDKIYQLILEQDSYFVTDPNLYETTYECFSNGGAYFCEITLQKIDLFLRDMEDDYGILPIPKWDEAQSDYLSCVNGAGGFVVVPSNPEDAERTGMILEALAAGAYDTITPSIYEVITKTKNVRDEESAEMVNLIIRNRVYDPFYINLCSGYNIVQTQLSSKKEEIASAIEKQLKGAEKALTKIIDAYASLE
ncbi:MAG: carbohydrate ABC transporter substrate-binding protein [Clostridia bacterium]|nr:carbohydrate ABC transporter substrate-binding protein [Clostridia bacterium]